MADPNTLSATISPGQRNTMRRPVRSTSQSPARQRPGDALLSRLTPASAVEALRIPSGPLKVCLDDASPSEQHFAMRTAVASKKIHEWLEEVSDWPWPKGDTSAGFELPLAKRRRVSEPRDQSPDQISKPDARYEPEMETEYMGSLPAAELVRFEHRIEQVQRGLDELDLEEIKSHVLLNHIMPLSRPGTPFSDAGRSVTSSIYFTRMEDITAVITAITVQALPNLSRLTRLLKTWTFRVIVLRMVPSVLRMITDAETALQSGWNAIELVDPANDGSGGQSSKSVLDRKDFDVMKSVLKQKVAQPGRDLDYMLDVLEGMTDTLPDDWLDRMDVVEKRYADWVATAEQRVQEGEQGQVYTPSRPSKPNAKRAAPETPNPKIEVQTPSPTKGRPDSSSTGSTDSTGSGVKILIKAPSGDISQSIHEELDVHSLSSRQSGAPSAVAFEHPNRLSHNNDEQSMSDASEKKRLRQLGRQKAQDFDGPADGTRHHKLAALAEVDRNILRVTPHESLAPSPQLHYKRSLPEFETETSFLESVNEEEENADEDEPQLPPARFIARMDSRESMASTVLHDPASAPGSPNGDSSRGGSMEPELPRLPDPNRSFSSDGMSPPSSPPLRYHPRSRTVSFNAIPEASEMPEDEVTPPRSPLDPPEVFDAESSFDFSTQMSSPSRASIVSESGDELHQQIRAVLKGLPNKIHLSTRPSAINLNPPDLQLPSRSKPRAPESLRRSGSALSMRSTMSSRSGTPSWLLAPARAPRPQSRASNETKTYYLSHTNGEAPMKLLVRCVGENGERVMVRVGGGWADLGEYLKEYAIHHSRRSKGEGKVEVRDSSTLQSSRNGSSPPSRPGSAMETPMTPLAVRKTRRVSGAESSSRPPATPYSRSADDTEIPSSAQSSGTRASRALSNPNSSILGMSGPHPKKTRALDEESRQWVEDMRNKVRTASGEQRTASEHAISEGKFGELGKVGGTKRVFRKNIA